MIVRVEEPLLPYELNSERDLPVFEAADPVDPADPPLLPEFGLALPDNPVILFISMARSSSITWAISILAVRPIGLNFLILL